MLGMYLTEQAQDLKIININDKNWRIYQWVEICIRVYS